MTTNDLLPIRPLESPPDACISVPGSKSITNRALILAALADGRSVLRGALFSDDTRVMVEALRRLGFGVETDEAKEMISVEGQGGRIPADSAELFASNSGTSIRFLTALTALGCGHYRLDGTERMRQRPQGDLLEALQSLGVTALSEAGNGCPPIRIESRRREQGTGNREQGREGKREQGREGKREEGRGKREEKSGGGLRGGTVRLRAEASSQFLTALLMVAPYAASDLVIEVMGPLRPFYVEITRRMMAQWGVRVEVEDGQRFVVPAGQRYAPQPEYTIEPDASSASYFFAAAALTGGRVTVPGLGPEALQGDVRFATVVLAAMGCAVMHDA
ncbi:MAG TPA: hypothetical protein VKU00_33765, partial [Chthonomonadaceae bacterium]|nr:hypothetical protein [Chthonomonadaceae bacterium]